MKAELLRRPGHEVREMLMSLSRRDRRAVLARLGPVRVRALMRRWDFWARREQLAPPGDDWRFWLVLAGRGFGKTRCAAEWVHERVRNGRAWRIALAGQDSGDVRDVMVEGPSGLLATADPQGRPRYEPSKRRVTFPGGAVATAFSSDAPGQARGPEHDTLWLDEYAAMKATTRMEFFSNLDLGLRRSGPAGNPPQGVVTTTPRPLEDLIKLRDAPSTRTTTGSSYDNVDNLDPTWFAKLAETFEGTRLGRQEIHAEILDDVEGAMWTSAMIDAVRVKVGDVNVDDMERIVIAIDPAATSTTKSSETGIVAGGIGVDGLVYILRDLSCTMRPKGWATRAVEAYDELRADAIVAEVNNGGEMVEETILAVSPTCNVRMVRASKGKRARAEPVAALYETTPLRDPLVRHVGAFVRLEKQMTSYIGLANERSPDRLDALVWLVHDLALRDEVAFV